MAESKDLLILSGEIKTPPLSGEARIESGYLLRQLQNGVSIGLPQSRPMPSIGARCHELRIVDDNHNWRIVYHIDENFIVILDIFDKKTRQTPDGVLVNCRRRLKSFLDAKRELPGVDGMSPTEVRKRGKKR